LWEYEGPGVALPSAGRSWNGTAARPGKCATGQVAFHGIRPALPVLRGKHRVIRDHTLLIAILLIEDNPADARMVKEMLTEDPPSFEVIHVTRLEAAPESLTLHEIGGILLDLSLPTPMVLRAWPASESRRLPYRLLIMSGNEDETLAVAGVREGAQGLSGQGQGGRWFVDPCPALRH